MKIENSEALKCWLAASLSKMCEADPAALSKYILALVKKDKSESELREFCLDQLDVFLLSETERFVDLLFEVLNSKAYLNDVPDTQNSSIPNPIRNDATVPASCESELSEPAKESKSPKYKKTENDAEVSLKKMKAVGASTSLLRANTHISPEQSLKSESRGEISEDGFCKRSDGDGDRKHNINLLPSKRFHPTDVNEVEVENCKRESDKHGGGYKFDSNEADSGCRPKSNSSDKRKEESKMESDKSDLGNMPTECQDRFLDHGDTDYRQKGVPEIGIKDIKSSIFSISSSLPRERCGLSNNYFTKVSQRCHDYDEKGYCMRGDLCQFDHGTDPILVENLNFGIEDGSKKSPKGLQPPPTSPPLPPPMPPGSFFSPEPYNPESPGMNVRSSSINHLSFFGPSLSTSHHMSPLNPSQNMTYKHGVECFHNSKPIRARELIGVPTVDSLSVNEKFTSTILKNGKNGKYPTISDEASKSSLIEGTESLKRKAFDYNRLGKSPLKVARFHSNNKKGSILEIRKIPKNFNTITMLNSHFSKFGKIVNIKVGYAGDAEAALVEFSSHVEANSAYRSSDAVFNNRFIKVFWHTENDDSLNELVNNANSPENENRRNEKSNINGAEKVPQRPLSMYSKVNNTLPRNTYPSSSLKKNNFLSPGGESLAAPTPVTRKLKEEEEKKDTLKKRLSIQTTKQDFLKAHMENQKLVLEKLSQTKNVKEKEFLKKTLHTMSEKIQSLQNELRKDSQDLKTLLKNAFVPVVIVSKKSTTERELLDAELELYNKQATGDDTAELLSKVNNLKQKAEAYIDSCLPKAPKEMGNSKYLGGPKKASSVSSHSIDHRPRTIIMKELDPVIDKQDLIKHFSTFGRIESVKQNEMGVIIAFSKRIEAELAYARGSKFGDCTIPIAWFQDTHTSDLSGSDNGGNLVVEIMKTSAADGDDEDEEEEEDSEARSWRR